MHVLQNIIVNIRGMNVSSPTAIAGRAHVFFLPLLTDSCDFVHVGLCLLSKGGVGVGSKGRSFGLVSKEAVG